MNITKNDITITEFNYYDGRLPVYSLQIPIGTDRKSAEALKQSFLQSLKLLDIITKYANICKECGCTSCHWAIELLEESKK